LSASVVIDCTWPKDWDSDCMFTEASFAMMYPDDIKEKVKKRWESDYGLKSIKEYCGEKLARNFD
ncbi:MAG: hypothetical protein SV062_07205, partial [Thermodesulfobacteriota bacterium]|nr:hypothetical protein [Thermodesulfobacteriota bacterium]